MAKNFYLLENSHTIAKTINLFTKLVITVIFLIAYRLRGEEVQPNQSTGDLTYSAGMTSKVLGCASATP